MTAPIIVFEQREDGIEIVAKQPKKPAPGSHQTKVTYDHARSDEITMARFVVQCRLTLEATRITSREDDLERGFSSSASHWRCTISRIAPDDHMFPNQRIAVSAFYSMGSAHVNGPSLPELLDVLRSDIECVENNRDVDEMAHEMGTERGAQALWDACLAMQAKFKVFFTPDEYEQLIWYTERM